MQIFQFLHPPIFTPVIQVVAVIIVILVVVSRMAVKKTTNDKISCWMDCIDQERRHQQLKCSLNVNVESVQFASHACVHRLCRPPISIRHQTDAETRQKRRTLLIGSIQSMKKNKMYKMGTRDWRTLADHPMLSTPGPSASGERASEMQVAAPALASRGAPAGTPGAGAYGASGVWRTSSERWWLWWAWNGWRALDEWQQSAAAAASASAAAAAGAAACHCQIWNNFFKYFFLIDTIHAEI